MKILRTKRMSFAQRIALVKLMKKHPQLIFEKFNSSYQREDSKKLWVSVGKIMHEIPGAIKNWLQWRRVWNYMRNDVKNKCAEIRRHQQSSRTNASNNLSLTEVEEAIRKLIERNDQSLPPIPVNKPIRKIPKLSIEQPVEEMHIKEDLDIAEESVSIGKLEYVSKDDYLMSGSENPPQTNPYECFRNDGGSLEAEIESPREQEHSTEYQDEHFTPIAKIAQELMKNSMDQARAQKEFQKTHLNLLKKQTDAIEMLVEQNKRHQENYERQLEIQVQLTKAMTQFLSRFAK